MRHAALAFVLACASPAVGPARRRSIRTRRHRRTAHPRPPRHPSRRTGHGPGAAGARAARRQRHGRQRQHGDHDHRDVRPHHHRGHAARHRGADSHRARPVQRTHLADGARPRPRGRCVLHAPQASRRTAGGGRRAADHAGGPPLAGARRHGCCSRSSSSGPARSRRPRPASTCASGASSCPAAPLRTPPGPRWSARRRRGPRSSCAACWRATMAAWRDSSACWPVWTAARLAALLQPLPGENATTALSALYDVARDADAPWDANLHPFQLSYADLASVLHSLDDLPIERLPASAGWWPALLQQNIDTRDEAAALVRSAPVRRAVRRHRARDAARRSPARVAIAWRSSRWRAAPGRAASTRRHRPIWSMRSATSRGTAHCCSCSIAST